MEGVRDIQVFGLHAVGRQPAHDGLQIGHRPGNDNVARSIDRGNRHRVSEWLNRGAHLFFAGAYGHHPSSGRLGLHQPPALGNELEPVFETEDPGDARGNVFTDAVTQHKVRVQTPRRPQLGTKRIPVRTLPVACKSSDPARSPVSPENRAATAAFDPDGGGAVRRTDQASVRNVGDVS